MRLPGRVELADGLVGGALSFLGGLVAGTVAYLAMFRGTGVDVGTVVLGFALALAVLGFLAEFVRCWITGPRFGPLVAALGRVFAGESGAGPDAPANRARRMILAGAVGALVVTAIWIVKALFGL